MILAKNRVERRGDMLKKMMSKVIEVTHASGRESMDMILSVCLNAANEIARHGGCAPAQWVLSCLPRSPATVGDEEECLDVCVLYKHLLMDQQRSVCSCVTERRHVKHSYDGTVVNELDVLFCERRRPWLDPTKLET